MSLKTFKNDRQSAILDFSLRNLSWVILVRVLTFCSICMVQLFCFVFELHTWAYHKTVCSQKLIRTFADIAVHICQIKRSAGNALTSISLLVALVIKGLIIEIKMS